MRDRLAIGEVPYANTIFLNPPIEIAAEIEPEIVDAPSSPPREPVGT